MTNEALAARLVDYAREMDRSAGLFRARSYRAAAFAILRLQRPLGVIYAEGGRSALESIPGIGMSMGYTLAKLLETGEFCVLQSPDFPERMLSTLPGVGPRLIEILRERLNVRSLEELLQAARSGQLNRYVGRKQLQGIVRAVETRLQREQHPPKLDEPSVELLLCADQAFRLQDTASQQKDGWTLRAQRTNNALAHRLGKTEDWVDVQFEREAVVGRRTIVTETRGELLGRRVVRGREAECRQIRNEASAA